MLMLIRNMIHVVAVVFLIISTRIIFAQTNSITSDLLHSEINRTYVQDDELFLISADSSISLTLQSLSGENDSIISGDFVLSFNRSMRSYDGNQILLKNAQAGFVLKNGARILTALQCSSVTSTYYDVGQSENSKDDNSELYTFAYGPLTMSVPLGKLSACFEDGKLLIKSSQLNILDEKNKYCPVFTDEVENTSFTLNNLLSKETLQHFYTNKDTFCISALNSQDSGQKPCRYLFLATRADFWFEKKGNVNKLFMRLSTSDDTMSGPVLKADIIDPHYLDKEFTIEHSLRRPVIITDPKPDPYFYIDWNRTGKQNKLLIPPGGSSVEFRGWTFRLNQCSLTPEGIVMDSFDIKTPYPFSENDDPEKSKNYICGFKGIRLSCIKDKDDLTLNGNATALFPQSFHLISSRGYSVEKLQKCVFVQQSKTNEYSLQIIHNGVLHISSSKNRFFNEKNDVTAMIDTLEIGTGDILLLRAEGTISKTFGDATDGKCATVKPLLAMHGRITVRYLARDFQIYVKPQNGKPLFSLPVGGLLDNEACIGLPKGSIGLFSDLTINTLLINGEFGNEKIVTPAILGKRIKFKAVGVDVMQTNDGPQLMLHAPKAAFLTDKNQAGKPLHFYEIDQVMLDMNKKIKAVNGTISVRENEQDPVGMVLPESIQKSFIFKSDDISIGSKQPAGDSSIQLQIGGGGTILTFNEPFKSTGLYGFKLHLEKLNIIATQSKPWVLDRINGKSLNLMQLHFVKSSSVQAKTKTPVVDSLDPVVISYNSYGIRVGNDSVSGGITITIPQSNLDVSSSFPFIPARKIQTFQDINFIVNKNSPFPQFAKIKPDIKQRPSVKVGNLEFKNTETWFIADTSLHSANTSRSNLAIAFSFREILKDSISLCSVIDTAKPCVIYSYLDGSWRMDCDDCVKTVQDISTLLSRQCFSKK